jgi:putative phosphoribosyl transferase
MTRFPNLRTGGSELAPELKAYRNRDDVVVLAIALGGLPVAHEVATFLGTPLDVVIIRRLFAPQGPGSQTCAVNVGGWMVIDENQIPLAAVPSIPVEYFVADAISELKQREQSCRRGRPPVDLTGKTVILVDCGIRTGLTMLAAIEALRTKGPAKIIAAVPVASEQGRLEVAGLADELVCLAEPEPFGHVGLWYADFSRPGDDRVGDLLESHRLT